MKTRYLVQCFWVVVVTILILPSCKSDEDNTKPADITPQDTLVELTTNYGKLMLWMYPETAIHRRNFFTLVESGFYDSTEFHRVVKNFVIQGGDPNSKDADTTNDGIGGPGYTMPAEIDAYKFAHHYGAIGAARLPDHVNPDRESSGSQFYIVVNPTGTAFLDGKYTVFGKVVGSMETADRIAVVSVNSEDRPFQRLKCGFRLVTFTHEELKSNYGIEL